jgi:basic membrane protein A
VKRVDNGVFEAIKQAQAGEFAGGTDLVFDLKNDGVGVGKINPSVPQEDIDLMNDYKARIVDGSLEVPAAL